MTTLSRTLGGLLGGGISGMVVGDDAVVWTPKTPTQTLLEWQKADAGISAANNAQFSPWSDQSGSGRDMIQATGANQPVYKTGSLNGLPVVSFTAGSSEVMSSALNAVGITAFTIAWVMRPQSMGSGNGFWAWAPALGSGSPFVLCEQQTTTSIHFYVDGGFNFVSVPQVAGAAHAYILTWTGSLWSLYQDGALFGTFSGAGGGNQSGSHSLYIANGTHGYGTVDFAELIVYGGALGSSDITSMSSYMRAKWGTP